MSNEKKHSPQHEELLKKQAFEQQEVKEVLSFIQKYAKPSAIILAVILIVVMADKIFKNQRHQKDTRADAELLQARTVQDYQAIVDDYSSTPAGPVALMALAKEKFNAGQIDEALALYTTFIKKNGHHELVEQAKLNLIACKESKEQFGDAHLLYSEFAEQHKGTYLEPVALMGKARCLEALNQLNEAQTAYEDIIVNFPESSWSQLAEANLKMVLAKKQ